MDACLFILRSLYSSIVLDPQTMLYGLRMSDPCNAWIARPVSRNCSGQCPGLSPSARLLTVHHVVGEGEGKVGTYRKSVMPSRRAED